MPRAIHPLRNLRSGRGDLRCQPPPQQPETHGDLRCQPPPALPSARNLLTVPPAAVAPAKNGGGGKLPGLSRKLFQKVPSEGKRKSLTEVKNSGNANTRTLAMVLRSERELLSQSKEQEDEIAALRLQLDHKDAEVEQLKDLCLSQREEIRTLKDAVLFPDTQPDRHVRDEISTLTGQIQCLAQELAQARSLALEFCPALSTQSVLMTDIAPPQVRPCLTRRLPSLCEPPPKLTNPKLDRPRPAIFARRQRRLRLLPLDRCQGGKVATDPTIASCQGTYSFSL